MRVSVCVADRNDMTLLPSRVDSAVHSATGAIRHLLYYRMGHTGTQVRASTPSLMSEESGAGELRGVGRLVA